MRIVTIEVVDRPETFSGSRFTQGSWEAAKKQGPLKVPYGTAMENIKLSGGLYRIKPETRDVELNIKGPKPIAEMSNAELGAEMHAFGKPARKKMTRQAAMDFVQKLREQAAEFIVDEEED